jgi:hypothetical protein
MKKSLAFPTGICFSSAETQPGHSHRNDPENQNRA